MLKVCVGKGMGMCMQGGGRAYRQAEEVGILASAGCAARAAAAAGMMAGDLRAGCRPVCPVLLQPAPSQCVLAGMLLALAWQVFI
jgi:hypothetical protein